MSEKCDKDSGGDMERLHHRFAELNSELGENQVKEIVSVTKALAHPQRLKLLAAIGTQEVCVCKLVGISELSQPAISHHLNILARTGLLRRRRKGRFNHYQANPDIIQQIAKRIQKLLTE